MAHPTGNENLRRLLSVLVRESMLEEFRTTVGFRSEPVIASRVLAIGKIASKRQYSMLAAEQLRTVVRREAVRNLLLRVPVSGLRRLADRGPLDVDWIARGFDAHFASSICGDAFYGYSGYARRQIMAYAAAGLPAVVESQHVLWRATEDASRRERERQSGWEPTLPRPASTRKRDAEDDEVRLATAIVSPSEQVSASIRAVRADARIVRAPYGCPPPVTADSTRAARSKAPLRVLFVGRVVAFKGLADLHSAVVALGARARFSVVGPVPAVEFAALRSLMSRVDYLGVLPRHEVLEQMQQHDVLVAPSLVEGRSLAVQEAVGQGLPIIVSPGTGAEDLARAGAGWVVPVADPDALISVLDELVADPDRLEAMRSICLAVAAEHSWNEFERPILDLLRSLA